MALSDIVRFLLPREDRFFEILEKQALAAHRGAKALARFGADATAAEAAQLVEKEEHQGDSLVLELEEALQKTFVTPIDREDIQRLSSELDDVLDLIHCAARSCDLFGVSEPTGPMRELFAMLVESTRELEVTLPSLRKRDYVALMASSRSIRQREKLADRVYRTAMSELFRDEHKTPKELLREMTVLEHLSHAVDKCEHVAHTLANLAVKHG